MSQSFKARSKSLQRNRVTRPLSRARITRNAQILLLMLTILERRLRIFWAVRCQTWLRKFLGLWSRVASTTFAKARSVTPSLKMRSSRISQGRSPASAQRSKSSVTCHPSSSTMWTSRDLVKTQHPHTRTSLSTVPRRCKRLTYSITSFIGWIALWMKIKTHICRIQLIQCQLVKTSSSWLSRVPLVRVARISPTMAATCSTTNHRGKWPRSRARGCGQTFQASTLCPRRPRTVVPWAPSVWSHQLAEVAAEYSTKLRTLWHSCPSQCDSTKQRLPPGYRLAPQTSRLVPALRANSWRIWFRICKHPCQGTTAHSQTSWTFTAVGTNWCRKALTTRNLIPHRQSTSMRQLREALWPPVKGLPFSAKTIKMLR